MSSTRRFVSRHPAACVGLVALALAIVSFAAWRWKMQQREQAVAYAITGGDATRAPDLLRRFGCVGCHTIPGIPGADGQVGASLAGLRERAFIAGVVRNTPENLMRWIVQPRSLSPRTAMPATGIDAEQARDVAAYLYGH